MKRVIVRFDVYDEHDIENRLSELVAELEQVQENSEVGLMLYDYDIKEGRCEE